MPHARYSTTTRQPQPPFRVRLDWVCMRGLEASNSVSFQQGELWSLSYDELPGFVEKQVFAEVRPFAYIDNWE